MEASGFRDLVRRAQAGETAAVDQFLRLIGPYLEQVARPYADAAADDSAADLAQDVRLQLWLKLGQFQGGPTDEQTLLAFRAWLRQVVYRQSLRRRRDRARHRRRPPGPLVSLDKPADSFDGRGLDPPASELTPQAAAQANETIAGVRSALDAIDSVDREIVQQRFAAGRSLRQVAQALGLSYDEVRSRFNRAMEQLEKRLNDNK